MSSLPLSVSVTGAGPGAIAQIRLTLVTPHNLASGGFTVDLDPAVFGTVIAVDIISANGGQRGQSTVPQNQVTTTFASDSGGIGQLPGVPAVVITVPVLSSATVGQSTSIGFQFGSAPWADVAGNSYVPSAPMTEFTVGGGFSIDSVTPGGGLLPAGTKIQIMGHGFFNTTQVQIAGVPLSNTAVIGSPFGPTETDVTLAAPADITGRRVLLTNADGTQADFYPALRAEIQGDPPDNPRLSFPQLTVFGAGLTGLTDSGVAAQNPTLQPVAIQIQGCGPGPNYSCEPEESAVTLAPSAIYYSPLYLGQFEVSGAVSDTPVWILAPVQYDMQAPNGLSVGWSPNTPTCQTNPLDSPIAPCILAVAGAAPVTVAFNLSLYETVPFTTAVNAAAQPWLSVSPESGMTTGNAPLMLTADPNLPPGDYTATVTITPADPVLLPLTIPLTFRVVSSLVSFQNNPPYLYFVATNTDPIPPPVPLQVTATVPGTPFTVQALTSDNQTPKWLLVSPTQGVTPATLNATVDPSQPATGTVNIYAIGPSNSVSEPVGIMIKPHPGTISPNPVTFWAKAGGSPPPSQAVSPDIATDDIALSTATEDGAQWLSAAASGNYVSVQVNQSNLAPGTYHGTVTVNSISQPPAVPDQLSVQLFVWSAPPSITLTPASIELTLPSGGFADVYVTLLSGNLPVDYVDTVSTSSGGNWLYIYPEGNTLDVYVNSALPPGKYQGNVSFIAPSGAPPTNLPVNLTVTDRIIANPPPRLPLPISVVNGASLAFGPIAPGELLSIFGAGLDANPGLQVLIDGLSAQVLPVSPWQVNVVVPIELDVKDLVTVEVQNHGGLFLTSLNAASAAPGIVTADGTGTGTAQGFSAPVARGAVAKLLVTGIGEVKARNRILLPRLAIHIGGIEVAAQKIQAVENGIYEVEFLIPATVSPGPSVPVLVSAGAQTSQPGVTIPIS